MPTKEDLMQRQALPLRAKVLMSQNRIREWYNHFGGNVCISFSGGKDSTVLAHLVHEIYQDVPLVFADTGLEYPEIRKFAEKMGAEFVRPKMRFDEVISKYGYPLISKEVAEAIHFARRIVAKNPESLDSPERERERESTAARRRNELHGERDDTELILRTRNGRQESGPARTPSTDTHTHTEFAGQNRMAASEPHREHAVTHERTERNSTERESTTVTNRIGRRELRRIQRARDWLMGK